MNLNCYVPDSLIPILICFPTYETSCKFSLLFYENYKSLPQHKVLFDEYVIYTNVGYKLGSIEYETENGYEFWHKNEQLHRGNDEPAVIYSNAKEWYKNGKLHRGIDQPAYIVANGLKQWCKNGRLHRDNDKPAFIHFDGTQEWFVNGKRHRENNNPSVIWSDGIQEWWIDGKRIK